MKNLVALFAGCLIAAAQSVSLSVSPSSVPAGGTATVTLNFVDSSPSGNMAGLQWVLTLPTGITAGTGSIGASAIAGQKQLTCNNALCLLIGSGAPPAVLPNASPFISGAIVSFPLTVGSSVAPGQATIALSGLMAADTSGLFLAISSTGGTLTVLSKYDLTGNGKVDDADIAVSLSQALGQTACTNADVNGDRKCDIRDVILEILARNGVIK